MTMHNVRSFDLSSRAMLVTLSVRQWTARKLDKRITDEVNASHGATADAGRYNKSLIARDALAEISAIVGKARADHAFISLPWLQDGARIMPADAWGRYTATMRAHREAFEAAVARFVAEYPAYVEQARISLNGMFRAEDYPDASEIARRFAWESKVLPLPAATDFRVTLSDGMADAIRSDIESTMRAAVHDAMGDAWARLHDVTRAMADKLAAYKPASGEHKATGIFRDSLVDNVRELVDVLPLLNVTGDAALAGMVDNVRDRLTRRDAAELREDEGARAETAAAAAELADAMAAFMGA